MRRLCLIALCGAIVFAGCDRICGDEASTNVAGDWLIKGEATCANEDGTDTDISLNSEVTLPISQSNTGASLALGGGLDIDDVLFSFMGTVNGSCVDFSITEEGPDYSVSYDFSGVVEGNEITGDVRGNGTGICPFEGSFEATIYPSGGTSRPPDSGVRRDTGVDPLDAGFADTGTITDAGTSTTSTTTTSTTPRDAGVRECFRTSDCDEGVCQNGDCVIICEGTSDCSTGQKCIAGRCEDAQGCNCDGTGGQGLGFLWGWLTVLLLGAHRLLARRRSC